MQRICLYLAVLLAGSSLLPASALALDLAAVALIGSGIDTGDARNNPYQLQFGAAGELTISGFVVGVRGTRSVGSDKACGVACVRVDDLRSFGGDVGFDWEFALLHVSPRLGVGRLKERNGDVEATYLEPGGVAELELGILTLGAEMRYRLAIGEPDVSGVLGYLRLGLRF